MLPLHGVGEARPDFPTVAAMLDHAAATAPEVVALRHRGQALSYAGLDAAAGALAHRLAARLPPGEVVALLIPNGIAFHIAYWAALKARLTPALLNAAYPVPQLAPLAAEAAPRLVLHTAETAANAAALGAETLAVETAPPAAPALPLPPPTPQDIAALLFTGGTTGTPKAVEHSHARTVLACRAMEYNWPTRARGETWLALAPFAHIFGFMQGVVNPVFGRATIVIPERFRPGEILALLAEHRVTVLGGGPPALYAGLLAAEGFATADLSALRVCPSGGAPFPAELSRRWREATGLEIHEGYGMTEMAAIAGANALTGLRPGAVGKPIPCNEVQVVEIETGTRVLPAGERGEIRVRGPHMMQGYRNRPAETAQAIREGFLYTGDIGHLDSEGFLFITDRRKDVVIVKGFNVFPREVEEAIHAHPAVGAVGVIGTPDARSGGERVIAFVVPRPGAALDAAAIAAHCAARLAPYACPAEIRILDALPMTAAGKTDRLALRCAADT